jgi:hypothetical protein
MCHVFWIIVSDITRVCWAVNESHFPVVGFRIIKKFRYINLIKNSKYKKLVVIRKDKD